MSAASPRLPVSVMASLSLHGGALGLYLYLAHGAQKQQARVISNVDLLIQVHRAALPKAMAKSPTPPSTWNFLKMALPAVPKIEPRRLEVKVPELKRNVLEAPKLDDRGRRAQLAKMEALDLSQRRVAAASVEEKLVDRHTAALANLPKLEEIGTRRVRNLPAALALEEKRREAVETQQMQQINVAAARHAAGPQLEALQEAAPAEHSRIADKIASMLPTQDEKLELKPQAGQAAEPVRRKLDTVIAPPLEHRAAQDLAPEKKKGVEIEGPLADRKVAAYEIPEFPSWARDQGILEAAVAIRFYVSPQGDVLTPLMRVERTSGYGRLDRLAMESLQKWRFVPLMTSERQWGIITFRFLLE